MPRASWERSEENDTESGKVSLPGEIIAILLIFCGTCFFTSILLFWAAIHFAGTPCDAPLAVVLVLLGAMLLAFGVMACSFFYIVNRSTKRVALWLRLGVFSTCLMVVLESLCVHWSKKTRAAECSPEVTFLGGTLYTWARASTFVLLWPVLGVLFVVGLTALMCCFLYWCDAGERRRRKARRDAEAARAAGHTVPAPARRVRSLRPAIGVEAMQVRVRPRYTEVGQADVAEDPAEATEQSK